MKKILCLIGRSGVGKDTIANIMSEKYNLKQLISYTTRPKREGEGKTHIFITNDEYEKLKPKILAYTEINGYHYFSTKDQVYENDIYVIDPVGYYKLKRIINDIELVPVYITVNDNIKRDRVINNRHDDPNIYETRIANEDRQFTDFERSKDYKYVIENNDLTDTIIMIESILKEENFI